MSLRFSHTPIENAPQPTSNLKEDKEKFPEKTNYCKNGRNLEKQFSEGSPPPETFGESEVQNTG